MAANIDNKDERTPFISLLFPNLHFVSQVLSTYVARNKNNYSTFGLLNRYLKPQLWLNV